MDFNIVEGKGTTTGTNTYAVTLSVGISALKTNGLYIIIFTNANTGASTLNINSLGAKAIKDRFGNALESGSIEANVPYQLRFDGTNFNITEYTNPFVQNSGFLRFGIKTAGNGATDFPQYEIIRARGTVSVPSIVSSGDIVGGLLGKGYDGANYQDTASIRYEVDGAPGANDMPGRIVFLTTPDGSTTLTERVRIDSSGALLFTGANKKLGATDSGTLYLAPFVDSTTAFQVREADDTEVVFNVDTLNGRIGIQNATGATPQYLLDMGNLSYFAINGNFAHIIQHNSAASTFWSIAPRNGGDLDIAVTTTDPRPTSGTIGTADNVINIKSNKDVDFIGSVTASNLKNHALVEVRGISPNRTTTSTTFVTLESASAVTFSGRPVLCFVNVTMFPNTINVDVELAIQIDAGTDVVAAQTLLNNTEHNTVSGAVIVTPTAGSHTLRVRWRQPNGAGTLNLDANDQILLHAIEL